MTLTKTLGTSLAWIATMAMAHAAPYTFTPGNPIAVQGPQGDSLGTWTFIGGAGALELSNGSGAPGGVPTGAVGGLVGTLNVAEVHLTPLDGAQYQEATTVIDGDVTRAVSKVSATVTSVTVDDQTGAVLTVGSQGGALEQAERMVSVLKGGGVAFTNLRFDLIGRRVIADVSGTPLVYDVTTRTTSPGITTTVKDLYLWDISYITGPTTLLPSALAEASRGNFTPLVQQGFTLKTGADGQATLEAANLLYGLKVTEAGFNLVAQSLGITSGTVAWTALAAVNDEPDAWGSITSTITFAPSVPEPQSYMLMGLGLLGIVAIRCKVK